MTMHAQSIRALVPGVGPFVGPAPEDRHAERVVRECLAFLSGLTGQMQPQLNEAMGRRIGGSLKAQARFLKRIEELRSPAVIEVTWSPGKRCRFFVLLSLWETDEHGGATVWWFIADGQGPGRVARQYCPMWRISRHALVRLVQRAEAHDALRLLVAMRGMAGPVMDAIADAKLGTGDGQTLKVPFPTGIAILEWPDESPVAVVKTILPASAEKPGA
jgi:hypothetical protein